MEKRTIAEMEELLRYEVTENERWVAQGWMLTPSMRAAVTRWQNRIEKARD